MLSKGTPCITEGCTGTAKGGHRYCARCLAAILSGPPSPLPLRESAITYRAHKRKK